MRGCRCVSETDIIPVSLEARKYDNPLFQNGLKYEMDSLNIRKSPYMYGWDIFPRMLSGGIWKSVRIFNKPDFRFIQSYLFVRNLNTDYSSAQLEFFYEVDLNEAPYHGFEIVLEGHCKESSFSMNSVSYTHLDVYKRQSENNEEDTIDMFAGREYKIVGICDASYYINYERGSTALGNGKLKGYICLLYTSQRPVQAGKGKQSVLPV